MLNADVTSLLYGLVAFVGCAALGALLVPDKRRVAAADPVVGLGLASMVITLVATTTVLPLTQILALVGLISLISIIWLAAARRHVGSLALAVAVLTMAPLLLLATATPIHSWDDFMHWMVNAAYLYRYDSLPKPDLPPTFSVWPAYPYTLTFWTLAVSRLTGRFIENAAGVANLLLLSCFAAALVEVVLSIIQAPFGRTSTVALAALAATLVTALGPGFKIDIALSAHADIATAVATGFCGLLGWKMMEHLLAGQVDTARPLAWQFGACAALLVNLKQPNILLLGLLLAGLGLIILREPRLCIRRLLSLFPALLGPAIVVWLVWHHYVAATFSGSGEFHVPTREHWHLDLASEVASAMLRISAEQPALFALLFGALAWAGFSFVRRRHSPADRLNIMLSVAWLGYFAFLWFVYLAVFSPWEAAIATQFFRYSSHLSLLATLTIVVAAAQTWPVLSSRSVTGINAVGSTIGFMLLAGTAIASDRLMPRPIMPIALYSDAGAELAEELPPGSRLMAIDHSGADLAGIVLRYELWRPGREDRDLRVAENEYRPLGSEGVTRIACAFVNPHLTHVFVSRLLPEEAHLLGLAPAPDQAVLLTRGKQNWVVTRSWSWKHESESFLPFMSSDAKEGTSC
jgi:hypothetical protein